MNEPDHEDRLPASIGGLLRFAGAAYLERAPLYLALALLAFAIDAIVQAFAPDRPAYIVAASIVGDALLIAAVALGVGTRAAGETAPTTKLFEAAVVRWGDVAGASGLANVCAIFVQPVALFVGGVDAIAFIAAPMAWLLLGALSLAGPVTALSGDRPIRAIVTGFGRALFLSLRLVNLGRLLVPSTAAAIVVMLQLLADTALRSRGVPHVAFWANDPLDVLLCGPLTALQAAFGLDFARRLRTTTRRP